jgi:ribosomal protein S18 acetylase RimI-like enzyme
MQTSNEAGLKFYARCGFEIVKKIENYYEDITPPDSYLMKLQLNPSNQ